MEDLLKALNAAQARYANAADLARNARREEIAALNHLNDAQKAVDAAVSELRKSAPPGSDWKCPQGIPVPGGLGS